MSTSLTAITDVVAATTAVVGLFVVYLAYRGYRRNDSQRMRALSFGVFCIAVAPYLITAITQTLVAMTDATAIVLATLSHAVGLAAIYATFDR